MVLGNAGSCRIQHYSKNVIDRQLKVCSGRESESKQLVSV